MLATRRRNQARAKQLKRAEKGRRKKARPGKPKG
jgi:hypothetical protein